MHSRLHHLHNPRLLSPFVIHLLRSSKSPTRRGRTKRRVYAILIGDVARRCIVPETRRRWLRRGTRLNQGVSPNRVDVGWYSTGAVGRRVSCSDPNRSVCGCVRSDVGSLGGKMCEVRRETSVCEDEVANRGGLFCAVRWACAERNVARVLVLDRVG
ncbi:hypothetical protein MRB53_038605 [Persea americana]|nr:hypothetical protein MRB53_038605 [Persea americana]